MNTAERLRILRRLVGDVEKKHRERSESAAAKNSSGVQPGGKDVDAEGSIDTLRMVTGAGSARIARARTPEEKDRFLNSQDFTEVETSRGGVMVRSRLVGDPAARFGDVALVGLKDIDLKQLAVLCGDESVPGVTVGDFLFLDIETTSLALGTGNCVFLVGYAYLGPSGIVVEQVFAREPAEEPAMLEVLADRIAKAGGLITFNGKAFDLDVLETRYLMNRRRLKLKDMPHIDLLHVSRRLYRNCFDSCRLQELEDKVLGCPRDHDEDIPGELVPEAYFAFIRRGAVEALRRVFNHNYSDVLAMCALAIRCAALEGGRAAEGQVLWNVGRFLDRSGKREESLDYTRQALDGTDLSGEERREAILTLSLNYKRDGCFEEAVALWEELHESGDTRGTVELCKHLEHHEGDFAAALDLVEKMLSGRLPVIGPLKEDLEKRAHRLRCRIEGKRWY